jgi:hypothetical protein
MPFPPYIKEKALLKSRRHCCVCHEFAGRDAFVHHIQQEAEKGKSVLNNAIVLCSRCHGEAGHYNPAHPLGNKYSPKELKQHRDKWWRWCKKNPTAQLPKAPISFTPDVMTILDQGWKHKNQLTIHNKSDQFFHDIWIKLSLALEKIDTSDITIDDYPSHSQSDFSGVTGGGIRMEGHTIVFDAKDPIGRDAIYLNVATLTPYEKLTFTFSLPEARLYDSSSSASATITLLKFSDKPEVKLATKAGEVARSFMLPEACTLVSMRARILGLGEN